jgi:putative membrane protein
MLKRPSRGRMTLRRTLTIVALSTFLSTAAFAQSAGEKTGINSTLGIAPKTVDFINEAAMSDMLEIEAAKIAQQK